MLVVRVDFTFLCNCFQAFAISCGELSTVLGEELTEAHVVSEGWDWSEGDMGRVY